MLRISKLTDYATVILGSLAAAPEAQRTAADLAATTHVAAPTVSKLLKQLQRAQLVTSARGLKGGYRLARPAQQITAAQILDALEGPLALTACASAQHHCDLETTCSVGSSWQRVNIAIRRSLEVITLAELAGLGPVAVRFDAFDARLRSGLHAGPSRGASKT
jgi:FeS assembly SUF system regulator